MTDARGTSNGAAAAKGAASPGAEGELIYGALFRYTKALALALGYRDLLTRLHSERVLALSEALARRVGLGGRELGLLRIGASFHDIGKIGIPDRILLKPGPLDDEEWQLMRQHSQIGQSIIASTELYGAAEAATIIRHHHEHFDGRHGYPDGLAGEDIPLCSRIIAIADSYDGMAVTRAYHAARGHTEIMMVLHQQAGSKFDPALLSVFSGLIEKHPLKAPEH